jgi:hypothetical protein
MTPLFVYAFYDGMDKGGRGVKGGLRTTKGNLGFSI